MVITEGAGDRAMIFDEFPVTRIIRALEHDNLLPAILFRSSRKQCDADVDKLFRNAKFQMSSADQKNLEAEIDAAIETYNFERNFITGYPQYQSLIATGVGAHHAGQLFMWRLLLEALMGKGLLRMMIATGTVAAGVDFPARTVVVTAHSRRGNEGFQNTTSAELQQMAGRAGRRGKDAVGLCVVAPSRYCDARVIYDVSRRPAEPLASQYFASPSTVLNLLKYRNVDDLEYTVKRSLGAFHDRKAALALRAEALHLESDLQTQTHLKGEARKKADKRVRRYLKEADEVEQKQATQLNYTLTALRQLGYVEGGSLTEKGTWAAELCTSLVLYLAEAVESKIFDDCSLFELVGLVASIAGDSHRPYFSLKENPISKEYFKTMEDVVLKVSEAYRVPGGSEIKVQPDAALTVVTWLEANDWGEFSSVLRLSGVADGDVARLVTQTADHLNQLSRLSRTHKLLADAAKTARGRLLRPPFSDVIIES